MPTTVERSRALDVRRSLIFACASIAALASSVVQLATQHKQPSEQWWELSSVVVCGVTAVLLRSPKAGTRQGALIAATLFYVVTMPLVALTLQRVTDVVLVFALPLALGVVFIDRLPVVATVSIGAVVINPLVLLKLGWAREDMIHGVAVMVALYGAGVLGSLEFARYRKRDDDHVLQLQHAAGHQVENERLVVLGRLAADVAHEINNPLAFVTSNLAFLEKEHAQTEEDREVWSETREGLERIGAIVTDLRGLARAAPAGMTVVRVEELLRRTVRVASMRAASTVAFEVTVEADLPACRGDEQRLSQVLLNLAINACDALEGRKEPAPRIRLSAHREGGRVTLKVDDNGPGIAAAARSQLFTAFFTTKPVGQGTGLGLTLSREYVESFGGTLELGTSSLGGACFVVTLPRDS